MVGDFFEAGIMDTYVSVGEAPRFVENLIRSSNRPRGLLFFPRFWQKPSP